MHVEEHEIAPIERVLTLRALPEFEALTPTDLALVADVARLRRFARGELLMRPGVPMHGLHFVLGGELHVERAGQPGRRLHARDVVGDLAALFRDAPAPRIVAVVPSSTLELVRADIEEVFEDDFPVFLSVLRSFARALGRRTPALASATAFAARSIAASQLRSAPLPLVERVVVLRRSMDFAGAEIETLAELAQQAVEVSLSPGHELWRVNDPADHFVIVVEGTVLATRARGTDLYYGPGTAIGALESMSGDGRGFTVRAHTEVRALRVDARVLLDLIEDNPAVGLNLLRSIARGIGEQQGNQ
jgi:CRP-like cAMP-binding protein